MFKPLNKNILVRLNNIENHTNALYLGKNISHLYKVINIGKEVVEVKIDDVVYLNENKLINFTINNEQFFIIDENDIYMIVEE